MKWDFFLGTIAPLGLSKHVPTPIWVWEKNRRRLIEIEDTYQEEIFQEEMAAPIDEMTS